MLSVIICTYNREKFIGSALASLAQQTLPNEQFEILVINNKCTDNTAAIVDTFIAAHPELDISHILESNQGLSYARNRGVKEAKYEQLIFIDDDALAIPEFLSKISSYLDKHDHVAGGGKVIAQFETEKPKWYNRFSASMFCSEHTRGNQNKIYAKGDYPFGCNMIFKKSVFDEVGLFDVELGRKGKNLLGGEEKDIFTKVQNKGYDIFYLADAYVHHCIDDFRLEDGYVDGLSINLGRTHRLIYGSSGGLGTMKGGLPIILKFCVALVLAVGYSLALRFSVAKHLIKWRWLAIKGYFGS